MRINEIFYSLQGEGFLAGVPSVFIRLAGCPLRCRWCDTKYAWETTAGAHYTIPQLIQEVHKYKTKFTVITGGEPMIDSDIFQLAKSLKDCRKHITIETSGIAYIPDISCDLMSISPKLSNSVPDDPNLARVHEDSRLDIAILSELIDNCSYQLKFVVEAQQDLAEIIEIIEKIGNIDPAKVMLMPQAATRQQLLEKASMVAHLCTKYGFTFCHRLQLLLWDNQKGV